MMQMNAKEKVIENKTGMTSEEQVKEILARVCLLEKKKAKIYEQLMGELEPKGIRIINFNRLSNEEGSLLEQYFDAHIAPFLSPMVIGKQQPFPFLANKQLYAIVLLTSQKGKKKTGIVPCSNSVFKRLSESAFRVTRIMDFSRMVYFGYNFEIKCRINSSDSIKHPGLVGISIRRLNNADIDAHDLYDEDMDYRDMMEQLIKKRVRLDPVRVELSRKINDEAKQELSNFLEIGTSHIINVKTPLDLSFVFTLQNYLRDQKELFYEKRSPRETPALSMQHLNVICLVKPCPQFHKYHHFFSVFRCLNQRINDLAPVCDTIQCHFDGYHIRVFRCIIQQNYLRDQKELFYEKRSPRETPALSMHESILSQVEKKDVLLSYPFESMKPFIKMLNDAAEDFFCVIRQSFECTL